MAKKYTSKFTGQEIDDILTAAQESVSDIEDIYKTLEGKKNTIILSYKWDINYLKSLATSENIVDGNGNDISQAIKNGEYDNITIYNTDFNSNEDRIPSRPSPDCYYLILVPERYEIITPHTSSKYVLLKGVNNGNILEPGCVILVLETDVPDRWLVGFQDGFYALKAKTTLNIESGTGTNALQMKQDGDSGVFDFTDKNPNATALDKNLTGEIPYGATGNFATVLGGKASAQGKRSMAQGTTTIAKGNYSHAEGDNSVAYGNDSHAEGYATTANGVASHAEGYNTLSIGDFSHSEGTNTTAIGNAAHSEGYDTKALGSHSHSEGNGTEANGDYSHAEGHYTYAAGWASHTEGVKTIANYTGQTIVGQYNSNKENTLFEVGNGDETQRKNAFEVYKDGHAEIATVGITDNSVVNKRYTDNIRAIAEGKNKSIILYYSTTGLTRAPFPADDYYKEDGTQFTSWEEIDEYIGGFALAGGCGNPKFNSQDDYIDIYDKYLITSDRKIIVPEKGHLKTGDNIFVIETDVPDRWVGNEFSGSVTTVAYKLETTKVELPLNVQDGIGTGSVQTKQDGTSGVFDFTGKNPNATAIDETLTGDITYGATGNFATVVGGKASAQGKRSMAQGTTTIAKGDYSHSEGNATVALAANAHAEGAITTASGSTSHAEGQSTEAKGENSHAEGMSTVTEGVGSHSEGFRTQAKGNYSHAEGYATQALHEESHASGYYTKTGMPMQTVCGAYNVGRNNTFFEIGNGNATKSENAFEVYLDGHAEIQTMGNTEKSVATKGYVDNNKGTKLYLHTITVNDTTIHVISASSTQKFPQGTVLNAYVCSYALEETKQGYISWRAGNTTIKFTTLDGSVSFDIYNPGQNFWTRWDIEEI